ncbi:MAG: arginine repressor [Lachnospiraceae bacterium]|nr:arginine repressor [Lachnospiraceae bacterium]
MKSNRQNVICELIRRYEVETQDELVAKLEEMGFKVTQATVSRDIRELHLTKAAGKNGVVRYVLPGEETAQQSPVTARRFSRVLQEGFVSCSVAGNLLVIRTMTGMANAVAASLDSFHFPEAVGSIAGDDTIFIAIRNAQDGESLKNQIQDMVTN